MSIRDRVRTWIGVPPPRGTAKVERSLHAVNKQLEELRGLLHHQADFTVEALRRAGWQSEAEVSEHEALQQALRVIHDGGDVIAGPWTGEVGFELMYWIPFLNWLVAQGLDPARLSVVSRGGAAPWYRHLTTRYVDILDLMTPDQFRERTAGKKKQYNSGRPLDGEIVHAAKERLGLFKPTPIHPSAMFRLFAGLWRKRAAQGLVDSFTSYRPLMPPAPGGEDLPVLPADYVAVKFYFSKAFPDTDANRLFVRDLLRRLSRQAPVVLLSASVRLDEHSDFDATGSSGLVLVDSHRQPQKNLEFQTEILRRARGFIGTYGGFSYLAPFYGVRSVSFFSRRDGFEAHHLELADRVFDRLLPGGFVALDCRAMDLVQPAVERWAARQPAEHPDAEKERVGT